MKIFFVIFVTGKIFGFMGPLEGPRYGTMEACEKLAIEQKAVVERQIATGYDLKGRPISPEARETTFGCMLAPFTPEGTRPFTRQ